MPRTIGLSRKAPLKRKRAKKRTFKSPRCLGWSSDPTRKSYCKKPQRHIQRCQPHADQYLDGLVRAIVVTETCDFSHPFPCSGPIQANHGFDRGEKSVRWNLDNVFSGCAALNIWAFHHKRQWYAMVQAHIGPKKYAALSAIADNPPKLDYDEVLATLKKAAS